MNRETGKKIESIDLLKQSIADILTTPKGSRVLRRDYGCNLSEFIDSNVNNLEITYEVSDALTRFEPRFKLKRVDVKTVKPGVLSIIVKGDYLGKTIDIGVNV